MRGASAMVRIAQIGLKRSKNIAQGGSGFSVKDFIKNLVTRFPGSDNNADGSCLDWKENAKVFPSLWKESFYFDAVTPLPRI